MIKLIFPNFFHYQYFFFANVDDLNNIQIYIYIYICVNKFR